MINPIPDCIINPEHATGIAVTQSIIDIGIRGPYLSQIGPITIRNIDANGILAILAFHISCLVNPKSERISDMIGTKQYQHTIEIKYENHDKWNALICGRAKLNNLISVALYCSVDETLICGYSLLLLKSQLL